MKNKITLIAIVFILCGCGSRKVDKAKQEQKEEVKTEIKENTSLTDTSRVETTENYSNKINYEYLNKDFTFEPIDNTKPYFIGSKKYENVKVVNKENSGKTSQEIDFLKVQLDERFFQLEKETEIQKEVIKEQLSSYKETERNNTLFFSIIGIFLILMLIFILWLAYKTRKLTLL